MSQLPFARAVADSRDRVRKHQDVLESQGGGSCWPCVPEASMCKCTCSDDNHDRLCRIKVQKMAWTINEIGGEKSPYKSFLGFYSCFKARWFKFNPNPRSFHDLCVIKESVYWLRTKDTARIAGWCPLPWPRKVVRSLGGAKPSRSASRQWAAGSLLPLWVLCPVDAHRRDHGSRARSWRSAHEQL